MLDNEIKPKYTPMFMVIVHRYSLFKLEYYNYSSQKAKR